MTRPLPPLPAMQSVTDDAGTDPAAALQASTGRLIRAGAAALEVGANWAEDTAHVVLSQPAIRTAIAAIDVLTERHQARSWGPGSAVVVCTAGCGSYPCPDALVLRGVTR